MPWPTFVVIGAAKCGTTSLCDLLSQHPDVFFTTPKEPHYFSRLTGFERARDAYLGLFANASDQPARGEGSTSYTHPVRIDLVVPRMHASIPDARLIYIVRHPIRRLESDWKMRRREGRAAADINAAVEQDASLTLFGLYWRQLAAYRRLYRDEQILVIFFEEFALDPIGQLPRVYAHIGVDPSFTPRDAGMPRNAASARRKDRWTGALVRRLPGFDIAKRLAPGRAHRVARRLLTKEYREVPGWRPEVLHAVAELYREDSGCLLEHFGKPTDYWRLSHESRPLI